MLVLLIALTTWRLARVVAKDDFPPSVALRTKVAEATGKGSVWHYLVECVPCVSVYASAAVVAGTLATMPLRAPVLVAGAATAASVLLNLAENLASAITEHLDPDDG